MLHLMIGKNPKYDIPPDGWFRSQFDESYLTTDFSKRVIKEVDKNEVKNQYMILSPILGFIPPEYISSSAKLIIMLMYENDKVFDIDYCDNTYTSLLAEVASQRDVTVQAKVFKYFYRSGYRGKIHILNDNSYVNSDLDLLDKFNGYRV